MNIKFATLQQELAQIKTEMVTKQEFTTLENRVASLEQQGSKNTNPEIKALRSQLHRLDPAQKTLAFEGFVDKNLSARATKIEEILAQVPNCPPMVHIDHISKGPKDGRVPASVSLMNLVTTLIVNKYSEPCKIKI